MSDTDKTSPSSSFTRQGAETSLDPSTAESQDESQADIVGYLSMFREYVREQSEWIGSAETPLVFHVQSLCRQLDGRLARGDEPPAALFGAYLQAIERLNKRRPADRAPDPGAGQLPGQTDVFDFME